LDLYWATWAQEQFDGVRGGGKARIYQGGGGDMTAYMLHMRQMSWYYFGLAGPSNFYCGQLTALTSSYRPPTVVESIALDPNGRGRYAIHERPLGLAMTGYCRPPDYRLRTDFGGILRYSWCTPGFIMGTLMHEARPLEDWTMISSQNRWQGVVFSGDMGARIVSLVRATDDHVAMNAHWSVQDQGTLITQKLRTSEGGGPMTVWFSGPGLTNRMEEAEWVFAEAPAAYAAVRVAAGGTTWEKPKPTDNVERVAPGGAWLYCKDEWSPVIIEVAEKRDFANYAAFRKAVAALPLAFKDNVLTYRGLNGANFAFYADYSKPPMINDKPVDYAPPVAFDSPFVQSAWDSGVVTITKGAQKVVLDFNQ
jgi:hypothetical protein